MRQLGRIKGMSLILRKKNAVAAAKGAGVDGMLVTHLPDVRYLCGFTGSNGVLVLARGRMVLFTDGRYTAQARAEAAGSKVVIAVKPAVVEACEWMEAAGAHILLYAGFFQDQNKDRHNIEFYSTMGRECYLMAAVGKRAGIMKLMAKGFSQYLFHLANLHRHLQESRYLIRPEN